MSDSDGENPAPLPKSRPLKLEDFIVEDDGCGKNHANNTSGNNNRFIPKFQQEFGTRKRIKP